jgi:hypothetical protein
MNGMKAASSAAEITISPVWDVVRGCCGSGTRCAGNGWTPLPQKLAPASTASAGTQAGAYRPLAAT